MAGLNAFTGWGLSNLALFFLNKRSNSSSETNQDADTLHVTTNQTKVGQPIPAVLGTQMIKNPIVSYFGDFSSRAYTETYAAHAKFNAWPLVFALIMAYIAKPATGHQSTPAVVKPGASVQTSGGSGQVTGHSEANGAMYKDDLTGPLINSLFMWLLSWLINGRNLKTTIQKGFQYYLGWQQIVCWSGPNLRLRRIYMNEKVVWEGDEAAEKHADGSPLIINVDDETLFGGVDEQGGFIGALHVYFGSENQQPDAWMAEQMAGQSVQEELRGYTPAYRSVLSIVVPTAYIGKSATIPEIWVEVTNAPESLGLGLIDQDLNPAEFLYELHTNPDWGLDEPPDLLDVEALRHAGAVLAQEGVGISTVLSGKTQASAVLDTVLEHINGVKYSDPATGKLTFRLIRDDYDPALLLSLHTGNCSTVEFSRLDWGETVSKISVTYTDRQARYETGTLPAIDPANREINTAQTAKTYDYTYFTKTENALWAAKRELTQQAYPLATVSITGNRQLYSARIGDVVLLNWEPYGIKNMLLRVTKVDLGDFVDGTVKLETMEDVFGLEKTEFGFSDTTEWIPEEKYPSGVQQFQYMELPWELCQEDRSHVVAFALRPDLSTQFWTIWRQRSGKMFETRTTLSKWTAAARLVYGIEEYSAVEDLIGFEVVNLDGMEELENSQAIDFAAARKGSRLLAAGNEIIAYSSLQQLPNGRWYVKGILRGVLDTVPEEHAAQSTVFFIKSGTYANVTTGGPVCSAGTIVTEQYTITASTVDHAEEFDYMKVRQLTTTRRPEQPSVPGRIRMAAHLQDDQYILRELAGDLKISWTARDKKSSYGAVSQEDVIEYWSKRAFTTPEGTNYLARVSVGEKTKDYLLYDTCFQYTWAARCRDFQDLASETQIEIYAQKETLLSHQAQKRKFVWTVPTMVNVVLSEAEAAQLLGNWSVLDRVGIPDGPLSGARQIFYKDLPVVLIGTKTAPGSGGVYAQDGSYFMPTGEALLVKGKNVYEKIPLEAGFTFASFYVPTATGSKMYYVWDGTKVYERVV